MTQTRLRPGAAAERVAERFYLENGYILLARNYRTYSGELDLVLRRGPVLLVVEVKERRGDWEAHAWGRSWGLKILRIRRTLALYLRANPPPEVLDIFLEVAYVTQGRVVARFPLH